MKNAKKAKRKPKSSNRIASKISLPTDIPAEDISAKILTSISEAVERPFNDELNKWIDPDRRSLKSSLSVSIYSDITFFDGNSLSDSDFEEGDFNPPKKEIAHFA